jgi:hypothetical protein
LARYAIAILGSANSFAIMDSSNDIFPRVKYNSICVAIVNNTVGIVIIWFLKKSLSDFVNISTPLTYKYIIFVLQKYM